MYARPNEHSLLVHRGSQRRALDDLDARTPRIGDVGDDVAAAALARRLVELDAFRFKLLHERGMVFHVKADMVEDAMPGRLLRLVGFGEADLGARDVDDRLVVAGAGLAAERLGVPGLRLRDLG